MIAVAINSPKIERRDDVAVVLQGLEVNRSEGHRPQPARSEICCASSNSLWSATSAVLSDRASVIRTSFNR
jgi:hypothetical protein